MQAGAVNDTITINLLQTDGVTAYATTGYSRIDVIIKSPSGGLSTLSTPSGLTISGASGNIISFKTTASTFPLQGAYQMQVIVTYPSGTITKSKIFTQAILKSLV